MPEPAGEGGAVRRVVVTGIGLVNALGVGRESFWSSLVGGVSGIGPITRFDAAGLPVRLAGEVRGLAPADYAPRRLLAKSDRFAHHALVASELALRDAGLPEADLDPFRTGISFGNNSGGWDICERGFDEFYNQGANLVNPWQATAWFPTAAQGFVSIRYGCRGTSKSFACDRASGGTALFFALRSIRWGYNDVVLAGGAEAPITRLGVAAHATTGDLSPVADPERAYLPFDRERRGLVLGEGSAVLVLEEAEHARRRGARVYGEIRSVEQRTGAPGDASSLAGAMTAALAASGVPPESVDAVFAEGCGTPQGDRAEAAAIDSVFGAAVPPVTAPKAAFGHLYGASFPTDVAGALLAIESSLVPPTAGSRDLEPSWAPRLVRRPEPATIDRALVSCWSREGTAVSLVATRPPAARLEGVQSNGS